MIRRNAAFVDLEELRTFDQSKRTLCHRLETSGAECSCPRPQPSRCPDPAGRGSEFPESGRHKLPQPLVGRRISGSRGPRRHSLQSRARSDPVVSHDVQFFAEEVRPQSTPGRLAHWRVETGSVLRAISSPPGIWIFGSIRIAFSLALPVGSTRRRSTSSASPADCESGPGTPISTKPAGDLLASGTWLRRPNTQSTHCARCSDPVR